MLQHPPATQAPDPVHRGRPPFPHVPDGIGTRYNCCSSPRNPPPTPQVRPPWTSTPNTGRHTLPATARRAALSLRLLIEHHLLIQHDVADQALIGHRLAGIRGGRRCDDYRLRHPPMRCQHRLDLAELDAKPADLDLLIGTPQIPQLPISTPTHQIPGAIHPFPGRRPAAERARHKPRCSQPRPPHITDPTPAPATYNSPTTPTGTGRNHP